MVGWSTKIARDYLTTSPTPVVVKFPDLNFQFALHSASLSSRFILSRHFVRYFTCPIIDSEAALGLILILSAVNITWRASRIIDANSTLIVSTNSCLSITSSFLGVRHGSSLIRPRVDANDTKGSLTPPPFIYLATCKTLYYDCSFCMPTFTGHDNSTVFYRPPYWLIFRFHHVILSNRGGRVCAKGGTMIRDMRNTQPSSLFLRRRGIEPHTGHFRFRVRVSHVSVWLPFPRTQSALLTDHCRWRFTLSATPQLFILLVARSHHEDPVAARRYPSAHQPSGSLAQSPTRTLSVQALLKATGPGAP